LKVLAIEGPVIDAAPFIEHQSMIASENENEPLDFAQDFPLPVKSRITAGKVLSHGQANNPIAEALFVVGDDALSRAWLKKHAAQLQAIHAIGFVTNIEKTSSLTELSALAGLPLQPVDIDALADALGVNHYPFASESGAIWQ
jgi:integrating conjugative element protein (TIGR03765 family)